MDQADVIQTVTTDSVISSEMGYINTVTRYRSDIKKNENTNREKNPPFCRKFMCRFSSAET